jgi:phage-related protein
VRKLVEWALTTATKYINDAINAVSSAWQEAWSILSDLVESTIGVLNTATDWIFNFMSAVGDDIINWCVGVATELVNDAKAALTFGLNLVTSGLSDLTNWANDAVNWIENELIAPLARFVDAAGDWLLQNLGNWWNVIYGDFIAPIFNAAADAYQWASTALAWVVKYGAEVGQFADRFLSSVWHFMLDPIGTIQTWLEAATNGISLSWVESLVQGATDQADELLDTIEGWFN